MKKVIGRESLNRVLFEFFSIILAVLIALGVGEWRENISNDNLAEQALANIKSEVRSNYKSIKELYAVQDSILKKLVEAQKVFRETNEMLKDFNFKVEHQVLTTTAWESAKITQAVKFFDYETVEKLSAIYELKKLYQEQASNEFAQMGTVKYYEADLKHLFSANKFNLKTAMGIERTLIKLSESYLKENK